MKLASYIYPCGKNGGIVAADGLIDLGRRLGLRSPFNAWVISCRRVV